MGWCRLRACTHGRGPTQRVQANCEREASDAALFQARCERRNAVFQRLQRIEYRSTGMAEFPDLRATFGRGVSRTHVHCRMTGIVWLTVCRGSVSDQSRRLLSKAMPFNRFRASYKA